MCSYNWQALCGCGYKNNLCARKFRFRLGVTLCLPGWLLSTAGAAAA